MEFSRNPSAAGGGSNGGAADGIRAIGGMGGSSGNGGAVSVSNLAAGTIVTTGDLSSGIFAQSVGGDGGTSGGDATTPGLLASVVGDHDTAAAGGGGNGAGVTVDNFGEIETTVLKSQAIFAQSAGGGGGNGGAANASQISLGGNGGTGGAVSVTNESGAPEQVAFAADDQIISMVDARLNTEMADVDVDADKDLPAV